MTCTSPFQSLTETMIQDGAYVDEAFYELGGEEKRQFKMEIDPTEEEKTYYNLDETSQSGSTQLGGVASQSNIMGIFEAKNDLLSWQNRHPEHWGPNEVLDYVYFLADRYQMVDSNNFYGEHFNCLDGARMCTMSEEDFLRLEPNYGQYIYRTFRNLLEQVKFKEPPMEDTTHSVSTMQNLIHRHNNNMAPQHQTDLLTPIGAPYHHHHHHHHRHEHQHMHLAHQQAQKQHQAHLHQMSHLTAQQTTTAIDITAGQSPTAIEINGYYYDYDADYDADLPNPIHEDPGYGSGSSESDKESTNEELGTISKESDIIMQHMQQQQQQRYSYVPQVRNIHPQPPPTYQIPQHTHVFKDLKPGKRGRPRKQMKSLDGVTKSRVSTAKKKKVPTATLR